MYVISGNGGGGEAEQESRLVAVDLRAVMISIRKQGGAIQRSCSTLGGWGCLVSRW